MNNRLLVIEDNEQNLYLMRFLLERSGFTIIGAEDGRKGIEMALSCQPLAILLDIQLPQMDGYAVAAELRKHSDLDKVPIIAVTSYAMVGDREKCLKAGMDDHIPKPVRVEALHAALSRWLPPGALLPPRAGGA